MANLYGPVTQFSGYNLGPGVGLQPFARWDSAAQGNLDAFNREAAMQQARARQLLGGPVSMSILSLMPVGAISGAAVASQPRGIGVAAVPGLVDTFSNAQEDRMKIRELGADPTALPTRRALQRLRRDAAKRLRGGGLSPEAQDAAQRVVLSNDEELVRAIRGPLHGGSIGRNAAIGAARSSGQRAPLTASAEGARAGVAGLVAISDFLAPALPLLSDPRHGDWGPVGSAARQNDALRWQYDADQQNKLLAEKRAAGEYIAGLLG